MPEIITNKEFIPPLTGIRAIAAYCVFIVHFNPLPKTGFWGGFLGEFHTGVDIFFVLSGFLIAYRYYDSVEKNRKWLGQYIVNRVARIYPAFFFFVLLTYISGVLLAIYNTNFPVAAILRNNAFELFMNLSFLKAFFNELKFIGIGQGWTLTVEECFYFLAPLIFLVSRRVNLFIISFFFLVAGFLIVFFLGNKLPYGFFTDNIFMLKFTFFGKAFDFFLGIWLALELKKGRLTASGSSLLTWLSIIGFILVLIIISVVRREYSSPLFAILLNNFILPFFITAFFAGLLKENTLIKKTLSGKFFVLLGKSSYVFYLIHVGVIQLFISTYISKNLLVNFVLLNLLAIFFFKFLEEPLNKKIRSWYQQLK